MSDLNNVCLMGRLTKDPEIRTTTSGLSVCSFTIAVNRMAKKGESAQADFINVVAWRNTADFISNYFVKGQQICLNGRIQVRNYDDKNGEKKYVTEVIAESVFFCGKKEDNANVRENYTSGTKADLNVKADDFGDIDSDDDLPF